jgi:signal transduction histidine kinase
VTSVYIHILSAVLLVVAAWRIRYYRRRTHYFRTLVERLPFPVKVWDFSESPPQIVHRTMPLGIVVTPERLIRLRNCVDTGTGVETEHTHRGQTWRVYVVPLNHGTRLVAEVFVEITETKQALAHMAEAKRDMEQFAYAASHDLQEPLRMIGSYVSALFEDYGDRLQDLEALKMKEFITGGVRRMRALISDLLRFSRAGRDINMAVVPLTDPIIDAMTNLRQRLEEENALVYFHELPNVRGDHGMLVVVFQNLLSNAIKFRRATHTPEIHIDAARSGPYVRIAITDNGIGIEPRHQDKLFEVFSRLYSQEEYDGTGIGLALVRRIVTAHGGTVTVESEGQNKGTTIHLTLLAA